MKQCPYCAEQIQDEAIICRHCGKDLAKPRFDVSLDQRKELLRQREKLQDNLGAWKRDLLYQQQAAQQSAKSTTWDYVVVILGLFLAPVGIGIIMIIAGLLAASSHRGQQRNAEQNQRTATERIESIRGKIKKIDIILGSK